MTYRYKNDERSPQNHQRIITKNFNSSQNSDNQSETNNHQNKEIIFIMISKNNLFHQSICAEVDKDGSVLHASETENWQETKIGDYISDRQFIVDS